MTDGSQGVANDRIIDASDIALVQQGDTLLCLSHSNVKIGHFPADTDVADIGIGVLAQQLKRLFVQFNTPVTLLRRFPFSPADRIQHGTFIDDVK